MATRPSLETFRVAPEGGQNYVSAPTPENAAPKQLMQLGGALVEAGSVGAQIFEDRFAEANKLRVEEATIKAMDAADRLALDPREGFSHVKGKAALERESGLSLSDEWGDTFDKELDNIADGLGNDAQRRAFQATRGRLAASFRGKIEEHTANEYRTYELGVVQGKGETLQRRLSLTAGDFEKTDLLISEIKANAQRAGQLTGNNSPEALDLLVRQSVTDGVNQTITSLLDNRDLDLAQAMFDRYKDDLTDTGFHQTSQLLRGEQRVAEAETLAQQAFDDYSGQNRAATPVPLGSPLGKMVPITGKFGDDRGTHRHGGVDFATPVGTPVSASSAGRVTFVGERGSYGYMVEVDHGDGVVTRYAHLGGFSKGLKAGDTVRAGQVIAASGGAKGARGAGRSTGPHLHYEVRVNGQAVDPTGEVKVGGGAKGSMTDAIQRIAESTTDPRVRQMAEQRFRSLRQAYEEDQSELQNDLKGQAQLAIIEGRSVPKSVLMNLDAGNRADVLEYQERVRKQRAEGLPKPGDVLWGNLAQEIVAGNIRDERQLAEFIPFLDKSDYTNLASMLKSRSPELDSAKTAFGALEKMNAVLTQYGLDPKEDAEEYGKFRSKYLDYIRRGELSRGKPLTLDEAYGIGVALATENPDGTRGYERRAPMLRYSYIPPANRARIENDLRARRIPVTREEVERRYAIELGVIQ